MYEKTTGVPKAFANIQGGGHTESDGFDKRRMTEDAIAMMDCHLRTLAILAQALKHFVPLQICKSTLERTYKRQILLIKVASHGRSGEFLETLPFSIDHEVLMLDYLAQ